MSNQTMQTNSQHHAPTRPVTMIPWDRVNEPGAYVCDWSGHLLRIPKDSVTSRRSPALNIIGQEPLFVTKICDNPYIPLTEARLLTSAVDMNVSF